MDYSLEYILKNPTLHIEDAPIKFKELKNELSKLDKVNSVLDVGCGAGVLTNMIVNYLKPSKALGIDISLHMINKANELNKNKVIQYKVIDIFSFKPEEKYDLIICADIIEHIENDLRFLQKLSKIGNKIVIRVPMENSFFNLLMKKLRVSDELKKTEERYGHIHHYSINTFLQLVNRAKLKTDSFSLFKIDKPRTWWLNEIIRKISNFIAIISIYKSVSIGGGFLVITLSNQLNHDVVS